MYISIVFDYHFIFSKDHLSISFLLHREIRYNQHCVFSHTNVLRFHVLATRYLL